MFSGWLKRDCITTTDRAVSITAIILLVILARCGILPSSPNIGTGRSVTQSSCRQRTMSWHLSACIIISRFHMRRMPFVWYCLFRKDVFEVALLNHCRKRTNNRLIGKREMAGRRLLAVKLFGWKALAMCVYWHIKNQKYGRKYYIIILYIKIIL